MNPQTINSLKQILRDCYDELYGRTGLTAAYKFNKINSICEIKKACPELKNFKRSIYQDIKFYLISYVKSAENKKFGYDELRLELAFELIKSFSPKERISLAKYFQKILKQHYLEDELKKCSLFVNQCEFHHSKVQLKERKEIFSNILILLSSGITYNNITIGLILLIIPIAKILILLPAPFKSWIFYKVEYDNISSVFFINHILNCIGDFFGITKNFKIQYLNWFSFLTAIFGKVFLILVIINFLIKELIRRLSIK
jgi:hypothetical protein